MIDTLYSDTASVSGLNTNLDYNIISQSCCGSSSAWLLTLSETVRAFLSQLDQWRDDWAEFAQQQSTGNLTEDKVRGKMRGQHKGSTEPSEANLLNSRLTQTTLDFYHA